MPEFWRAWTRPAGARNRAEDHANIAIDEAVVGLVDAAEARLDAERGRRQALTDDLSDERLVLAAIAGDAALARETLPKALENAKRQLAADAALRTERAITRWR